MIDYLYSYSRNDKYQYYLDGLPTTDYIQNNINYKYDFFIKKNILFMKILNKNNNINNIISLKIIYNKKEHKERIISEAFHKITNRVDIFNHEEKYPYLIKEFDSEELGFRYHVKIFKIDYSKFNSINS